MQSNKLFKILTGLVPILTVLGCQQVVGDGGYIHDRSNEYLISQNGKKLEVPGTMHAEALSDFFLIPDDSKELKLVPTIAPPGSLAAKQIDPKTIVKQPPLEDDAVTYKQFGKSKALVIKQDLNHAWLSVASALSRQEIPIIESERQSRFYKIADSFAAEAGVTDVMTLYGLKLLSATDKETTIQLYPLERKSHFNERTERRLLAQIEQGLKGKYKPKGILEYLGEYTRKF